MRKILISLLITVGLVMPSAGTAAAAATNPSRSAPQPAQAVNAISVPLPQVTPPEPGASDVTGTPDTPRINPCKLPGVSKACKKALKWIADHFPIKEWAKKGFKYFKKKMLEAWNKAPGWVKAGLGSADLVADFIQWVWDKIT